MSARILRQPRAVLVLALAMLVAATMLAAPRGAAGQEAGFRGDLPPAGGVALLVTTRELAPLDLVADLVAAGCDAETIAVTEAGDWLVYVPGAPAFVNEAFPESLAAERPFFVRCRADGGGEFTMTSASGGAAGTAATLVDVRIAEHSGFDRVVFEFDGNVVPEYEIEYIEPPAFTCGAGDPVTPAGGAALQITFPQTTVVSEEGELTIPSRELIPDLPAIVEAQEICAFEGMSIWLLGVDEEQPFRVFELASPARLVVDVPH